MSEVKWTKGPWDEIKETPDDIEIWAGGMMVARAVGLASFDFANAHLIAAAPELYAACSEMIAAVDSEGATGMWFLEAYNSACAALKKARGEGQEAEQR